MTSKIKVDNINKVSDDSNIIKKCGTTTTIGSGASNPIVVDGSAITLGRCGGTVALASGATQTGFGRTGTVDWQTGSIKTATFTAANGEGYFANTSGGAFTMNLPAGSAGSIVSVVDYTNTFQTNGLTITPNGSQKIGGVASSAGLSTEGQSVTFVYVDDTEGWKNVQDSTSNAVGETFMVATGGTITTSGNFKIHSFTGPGTFCVSSLATNPASNKVDYVVVGGGGAGGDAGDRGSGGGGAGGYRESPGTTTCYTASPLGSSPAVALPVAVAGYPVTIGAGGASRTSPNIGNNGSNSVFAGTTTITSTGGGGGGGESPPGAQKDGQPGGSGGGGGKASSPDGTGGSGNTPPVSPSQGKNGGAGGGGQDASASGGGGGGASAVGGTGSSCNSGNGGNGVTSGITGSNVARAGGGAGANGPGTPGCGGTGGGGDGGGFPSPTAGAGTVNTGGGGGGSANNNGGGAGGSGIIVIRYKFQ